MPDEPQDVNSGHEDPVAGAQEDLDISPSVRRLLRQYDVDISSIRGTGPNGRIRPGDVLAIVGNPQLMRHDGTNAANAGTPSLSEADADEAANDDTPPRMSAAPAPVVAASPATEALGTTVFVCNMSRVLAHRKRTGRTDVSVACYAAKAAGLAAARLHHLKNEGGRLPIRLRLTTADGEAEAVFANAGTDSPQTLHAALMDPAGAAPDPVPAPLAVHHHGLPGSLVDFSPPSADAEVAVLSLGGLQRTIGIAGSDAGETPRILVQSQLALTYRPAAIPAHQAVRFVAECVRILETWPVPDATAGDTASTDAADAV